VSVLSLLLVAVGAAVGAPVRFLVERRLAGAYPWGTFAVNVVGSAVLGALVAAVAASPDRATWIALVGTGFCGALTTFGGFAAQVLDLAVAPADTAMGRRALRSTGYALVSVVACVAVAAAAYALASP